MLTVIEMQHSRTEHCELCCRSARKVMRPRCRWLKMKDWVETHDLVPKCAYRKLHAGAAGRGVTAQRDFHRSNKVVISAPARYTPNLFLFNLTANFHTFQLHLRPRWPLFSPAPGEWSSTSLRWPEPPSLLRAAAGCSHQWRWPAAEELGNTGATGLAGWPTGCRAVMMSARRQFELLLWALLRSLQRAGTISATIWSVNMRLIGSYFGLSHDLISFVFVFVFCSTRQFPPLCRQCTKGHEGGTGTQTAHLAPISIEFCCHTKGADYH